MSYFNGERIEEGEYQEKPKPETPPTPVSVEEVRPVVKWFAGIMEQKLKKNDHKGGWLKCDSESLLERLREETEELENVLGWRKQDTGRSVGEGVQFIDTSDEAIANEAADIANFAMMIADVCGKSIGAAHAQQFPSLTVDIVDQLQGILNCGDSKLCEGCKSLLSEQIAKLRELIASQPPAPSVQGEKILVDVLNKMREYNKEWLDKWVNGKDATVEYDVMAINAGGKSAGSQYCIDILTEAISSYKITAPSVQGLIPQLQVLLTTYKEDISLKKGFETNAYEWNNEAAAAMWRHKREGVEKVVKDLENILSGLTPSNTEGQ